MDTIETYGINKGDKSGACGRLTFRCLRFALEALVGSTENTMKLCRLVGRKQREYHETIYIRWSYKSRLHHAKANSTCRCDMSLLDLIFLSISYLFHPSYFSICSIEKIVKRLLRLLQVQVTILSLSSYNLTLISPFPVEVKVPSLEIFKSSQTLRQL